MTDVIVVGAGPTGVWLACELTLRGIDTVLLERDTEPTPVVRGMGLHARTLELLDMRGLTDRVLEAGTTHPLDGYFVGIVGAPPELDTTHPYVLALPQPQTEKILLEHAAAIGVDLRRGCEVAEIVQHDEQLTVTLADGSTLSASWLVGCDGGRSTVRRLVGIDFVGEPASKELLLGEVELGQPLDEVMPVVMRVRETQRDFGIGPVGDGVVRVVVPAAGIEGDRATTLDEVRTQLIAHAGTDFGVHSPRWLSRFGDATRAAATYREGRVLLAGDAAHVHPPYGGQGMNVGMQDAFNLGWKLAAEVRGTAPDGLLDTYEAERRPVALDLLMNTRAQGVLTSPEPGPQAMRSLLAELMQIKGVATLLIEKIIGTGVRYDLGDEPQTDDALDPDLALGDLDDVLDDSTGAVIGRRLSDRMVDGGTSLYDHFRDGRGVLLDGSGELTTGGRDDRVAHVLGMTNEWGELTEAVNATAVLLRPDGHVAWLGDDQDSLEIALQRWFGAG